MLQRHGLRALLAFAAPLLVAIPASAQAPAAAEAALSAPADALVGDPVYVRAVQLLDTVLVRPERSEAVVDLRPEPHLLTRMLGALARDERAPMYARGNALLMLGRRGGRALDAFSVALEDPATEIRAAAAVGLGQLLADGYDPRVVAVLARALEDETVDVRARALEALADHEPALLRTFLDGDPQEPLATIARSMLRLAEHRGAPSAEGEARLGPLSRANDNGVTLHYRPLESWPQDEASQGELTVELPDGRTLTVADDVEVVAGVIPAFVMADGSAVVFESGREIHVLDLETGERHHRGRGIAPRPYPLRRSLLYFAPREPQPGQRGTHTILYDVVEAQLQGDGRQVLGTLTVTIRSDNRGGYSPLRWARIRELDGGFALQGEGIPDFRLPDPFALPE